MVVLRRWLVAGLGAVLALWPAGCASSGGTVPPDPVASPAPSATAPATLPHDPSVSVQLPEGEWAVLTDPDSGARMLMPRPLDPRQINSNGAPGIAYAGNGVNLQVLRIPAGRHGDLDGSVEVTLRSLGGRLISIVPVTVDGYEGRELFVEGPDGAGFVHVRMVVTETHVVTALAGGRDAATADERRRRAFPTFHVVSGYRGR